ncbi:MAG: UDP-2,4-diacetamido-2,4,6-trideoxy-beta-L-altropyranose hydrolase [Rhodospirillales bacterium]|nr:UDP-2,4-diacetamido-2,4,6-trideoxy-beta-L-altropyranose hydrolase [Rhodospirillales bacterium]
MGTIVFRTHAGEMTGLGHMVRCADLARELITHGAQCIFLVDFLEDAVAPFVDDLDVRALYDRPPERLDLEVDARLVAEIVKEQPVDWVVVDDYRLGREWEGVLQKAGVKICVIDDLLRHHQCDVLIDPKWRGDETQTAYDTLLPSSAQKLLGPDYALLSAPFHNKPKRQVGASQAPFTIMLGVGGAGDIELCAQIIDCLLVHQSDLGRDIKLVPVLGPLSKNTSAFVERYHNVSSVTPLVGEVDLYNHLLQSDLYIGAAGGILYQLMALGIPALTFALAESQRTDLNHLEDIGHFFHIENWSQSEVEKVPAFVKTLVHNYERVRRLCTTPKVTIDGLGTRRISHVLLGLGPSIPGQDVRSFGAHEEDRQLTDEHRIRSVSDRDINHYLISRNLDANCQNMISANRISYLDHYSWWFNVQRSSFLLMKNGSPCLYIWHGIKTRNSRSFLIGGWFVCGDAAGFSDVLLALNWQLNHCDNVAPGVPWIAVIHRHNKYVKLMNEYFGFQDIDLHHTYGDDISEIFNGACSRDFHYVVREPSLATQAHK